VAAHRPGPRVLAPRPGHRWVAPRWERDGKHWRQQRGRWTQETDTQTLHPVFTGAVPPKRDKARQPGADAGRVQGKARPAQEQRQTPRVEPDKKRENRRSGRRGQDDERRAD